MKKIVFLLLIALCLPIGLMAQSYDDDLYFIPSKEKEEPAPEKKEPVRRQATTNIYTSPGTTVVVQDRKGNTRDVDEYTAATMHVKTTSRWRMTPYILKRNHARIWMANG